MIILNLALYVLAGIGAGTLMIFAAGIVAYRTDMKRYGRR